MKLRILGCSGGIGNGAQTSAMLLDDDILIDAGTGVGNLSMDEMLKIDHIFVTHAHLDHVACIPFLVDTVGSIRTRPITVHATQATLVTLQEHLFLLMRAAWASVEPWRRRLKVGLASRG